MGTISWKTKVGCLKLLGTLAHTAPTQIGQLLPEVVPKVTENMWDTKPEVKQAAKACLGECCTVIHNPDVQPIVPVLISANANPKENVSALDRLMGTTFVSQVDRPTLAIIVPVLGRGLRDRDVQTKRKCCVVVDNMCKLVCDAKDVEPFVDKLLPELKKVEEDVPIPEIRAYGAKAKATLVKAIKGGGGGADGDSLESASLASHVCRLHSACLVGNLNCRCTSRIARVHRTLSSSGRTNDCITLPQRGDQSGHSELSICLGVAAILINAIHPIVIDWLPPEGELE